LKIQICDNLIKHYLHNVYFVNGQSYAGKSTKANSFDCDDPDKKIMTEQIKKCKTHEATLKNFNSWALYHSPDEIERSNTVFFTHTRPDFDTDTREETLEIPARHFGLTK